MRNVLDTGVLWRPDALRAVVRLQQTIVVPSIVFTERARQVVREGGDPSALRRTLHRLHFLVEPFDVEEGLRYAARISNDEKWKRLSRDAMIAGHLREQDLLWTTNPSDFRAIGVPEDQLVVVE